MHSYKHKSTRPLIPSKEEAGMEQQSEAAKKQTAQLPLNPVVSRGQDPELFWLEKYPGEQQGQAADALEVDIRSLYRHEHISPELLINKLYRTKQEVPKTGDQLDLFGVPPDVRDLFGNTLDVDEFEKVGEYYRHQGDWSNRLIQGDSLLVMTSLLEREGFAGKVQMIYLDPPYGINYGVNWQLKLHDRNMPSTDPDEALSSEPEQIKAFRDTWELGIHSYLSYLRDRLLVARELLSESGSCFVQISEENIHLVRCLLDEVFGSGNFCSLITFRKKLMPMGSDVTERVSDYLIWYSKNREMVKTRPLFKVKTAEGDNQWAYGQFPDGEQRRLTSEELNNHKILPEGTKVFQSVSLLPAQYRSSQDFPFEFEGKIFPPPKGSCWKTDKKGMEKLAELKRLVPSGNTLRYVLLHEDYPVTRLTNLWADTVGADDLAYVVQTNTNVIKRCILMTTDPGDLVLDPTCGSGTTAYVAEQWGRRWITVDTSRISINIAKARLMTAVFKYYHLHSEVQVEMTQKGGKIKKEIKPKSEPASDVREGFVYEEVPHIKLETLTNDEPPTTEILYDRPMEDKSRLRVAGPFTVETLQSDEILPPETLAGEHRSDSDTPGSGGGNFEERIFEHLKVAGIMNGAKNERAIFTRVERLSDAHLHAEGFYQSANGERKAYLHIGPQFGTVSKEAVNKSLRECRSRGDADWLIILGFSFESDISNQSVTTTVGSFEVTKVRMHDDLLQEGLTKKDKKAASFVTIGEPDVRLERNIGRVQTSSDVETVQVVIEGLDIYDPIRDEIRSRSLHDIAYWMVDDDYDGVNFIVRQVFFCGGDKDEFRKWQKGISDVAARLAKAHAQRMLRLELDEEAWERLYGFKSHPIAATRGKKIAVRVVSQFGEESMKVLGT